ncbi:5-methylcytosine-specific restriction enzyme B [Propionibacterium freudenreichii subsp. freudenreichii]|nr:5-methylcytosine-specific restriction enzyme B [Propionibacterium freudenreichii subsp. freudenreichii]
MVSLMTDVDLVRDVRSLSADDLDIGYRHHASESHGSSAPDAPLLEADDPQIVEITRLVARFGGVILTGPPGTGKSWLAGRAADVLTSGDTTRRADIQFHASYQFEDFMEGYRPKKNGTGFELRPGVFLELVNKARADRKHPYVLVIDELSRADVGRVFGEALTYVERSKRDQEFTLPSGEKTSIPPNIDIIATMNPLDRGVDEVDAAFERRFAKINMPPRRDLLDAILQNNHFNDDAMRRRLLAWFWDINKLARQTPAAAIGHAYFSDVVDAETLRNVWEYQLQYHVDRAFKYDQQARDKIVNGWNQVVGLTDAGGASGSQTESDAT